MIDLHSHILPGIDDGSKDMNMSLEMARLAVADGTTVLACTSHITPAVYDNNANIINSGIDSLRVALADAGIKLALVAGADVHVAPKMISKLQSGEIPCLAGSRYFLFEPPHHVVPPNLDRLTGQLLAAGYYPILTHPERLSWIERHYDVVETLDEMGVAIQLTAASITGKFGKRAQYWSQRMLEEGRVDIIASDAHDPVRRPPGLSRARDTIAQLLGENIARKIVQENPAKILKNEPMAEKKRTPTLGKSAIGSNNAFGWSTISRIWKKMR